MVPAAVAGAAALSDETTSTSERTWSAGKVVVGAQEKTVSVMSAADKDRAALVLLLRVEAWLHRWQSHMKE
jgi:hypothetical protein